MKKTPAFRVTLFEDEMTGAMVALLEGLHLAGKFRLDFADMDGGASLVVPVATEADARRLQGHLQASHVLAEVTAVVVEEDES